MSEQIEEISTIHLESDNRREFFETQVHADHLRVRLGTIGKPCLVVHASFKTQDKATAVRQRLVDDWLERGYVACQPGAEIVAGSVARELYCDEREAHALLEPFFGVIGADRCRGEPKRLALFSNGLSWHEDFDLERVAELGLHVGVIVDGDVDIDGVFSQLTYTYPEFILIGGSIRAKSFGHGDSSMRVLGDVSVDNIIYGEYNDGALCIEGSVHGRAFISDDHYMYANGEYHLAVSSDYENWEDCLSPDLFERDDEDDECVSFSRDAIRRFMREGRDPYVPGAPLTYRQSSSSERPAPKATPESEFMARIRQHVNAQDVEAMTTLIETWPERNEEWRLALLGRLCAPSTTTEQRKRLEAVAQSLQPPLPE